MRGVCVMRRCRVIARFVMLGRFVVMLRGRFLMLRGLEVVYRALMFCHRPSPGLPGCQRNSWEQYLTPYGIRAVSGFPVRLREVCMTVWT